MPQEHLFNLCRIADLKLLAEGRDPSSVEVNGSHSNGAGSLP